MKNYVNSSFCTTTSFCFVDFTNLRLVKILIYTILSMFFAIVDLKCRLYPREQKFIIQILKKTFTYEVPFDPGIVLPGRMLQNN